MGVVCRTRSLSVDLEAVLQSLDVHLVGTADTSHVETVGTSLLALRGLQVRVPLVTAILVEVEGQVDV